MILGLSLFAVLGILNLGYENVLPQILVAVFVASISDIIIQYFRQKKFVLPKTGIISGLFIGLILPPGVNLIIPVAAALIATFAKRFIKIKNRSIFNPAGLALTLSLIIFPLLGMNVVQSWWGSFPLANMTYSLILITAFGLLIAYRFKRLMYVFTFYVSFQIYFMIYLFATGSSDFTDTVQRQLMDLTFIFFTFLMLTEPKSTPLFTRGRLLFANIVALLAIGLFIFFQSADFLNLKSGYLLLSLIIANSFVPLINKKIK